MRFDYQKGHQHLLAEDLLLGKDKLVADIYEALKEKNKKTNTQSFSGRT